MNCVDLAQHILAYIGLVVVVVGFVVALGAALSWAFDH